MPSAAITRNRLDPQTAARMLTAFVAVTLAVATAPAFPPMDALCGRATAACLAACLLAPGPLAAALLLAASAFAPSRRRAFHRSGA